MPTSSRARRFVLRSACLLAPLLVAAPGTARAQDGAILLRMDERSLRAAGIELARVEADATSPELALPGTVVVPPHQLRVVAAPAGGLVEALFVAPDQPVRAGQPIARLRSTELIEAQRAFLEALAQDGLAAEKLRRDEGLFREKIIAERRLLTTRAEAAATAAILSEREQMLGLFGMDEAEIRTLRATRRLSPALEIRAPHAGVVLSWQAQPGERVAQSAPLFTVAQLRPLWVNVQVPVGRAAAVQQSGLRVAIPAQGIEGSLIRVGRSVDPGTQSVTAIAEFLEGSEALRPGQAVTVALGLRVAADAQWRVPAGSVVRHRDRHWVFVRTPEGFRAQPVSVLAETAQSVSVAARGLRTGEQVASRGILTLLSELVEAEGS